MASIRTPELTKGGSSHTVTWRDPESGLKTRTFSDKDYGTGEARDKALELKDFLVANGNSYKLAATAKVRKDSTAPTVYEVVVRHIDLLRKPQAGTIVKYRNMAASHTAASQLGRTPVDEVNKAAVIDWLETTPAHYFVIGKLKAVGDSVDCDVTVAARADYSAVQGISSVSSYAEIRGALPNSFLMHGLYDAAAGAARTASALLGRGRLIPTATLEAKISQLRTPAKSS